MLDDFNKRTLIHMAILGLIEKASIENWADDERSVDMMGSLLEINEELDQQLQKDLLESRNKTIKT